MLKLFIGDALDKNDIIFINDMWFEANLDSIDENVLCEMIKKIDDTEYVGNYMIMSKFNQQVISVANISTGCKTVLNVISFPNKIFSLSECGKNALNEIFKLKNGKCHMSYYAMPKKLDNQIEIITKDGTFITSDDNELEELLSKEFGEN